MPSNQRTVTEKRRAANQAAAQKSTGPKSPEGKQRAAFNSFQHGAFASEEHVLQSALARSGSDPAEFAACRQQLIDDWRPASTQQKLLVDDLAWFYWLRDQSAIALVEGQAQRRSRAQLERDQRRFDARHRAPAVNYDDYSTEGYAHLEASEEKIAGMAGLLDDLEDCLSTADWNRNDDKDIATPSDLIDYLYGEIRSTAHGQKLGDLWRACAADKAKAKDLRVKQIRALIEEERAALAEEEELFRRRQELDIEQPEDDAWPGLHPLGETWQSAVLGIERLDRQINAKVRLLIRLQEHAAKTGSAELLSNSSAFLTDEGTHASNDSSPLPAGEGGEWGSRASHREPGEGISATSTEIHGTKPSDLLESAPEVSEASALDASGLSLPGAKPPESDGRRADTAPASGI